MKTLIILHGWQSSKEKWEKVKNNLEEQGIRVILPDLPGFKRETQLSRAWNLDDYIEWLKNFLKQYENQSRLFLSEAGFQSFFLLGHSFGGRIAIKFAAKYPEKLNGLILVSSAGIRHKRVLLQNLYHRLIFAIARFGRMFSFLPFYQFIRKIFYKFIVRKTDYIQAQGNLKETFKKIIEEDLTQYLSQIKTPTLIIWGEKDKITPLKDAYLMKKEIPNSKLEILKDIKHTPYLENPQILAEKINQFIQ